MQNQDTLTGVALIVRNPFDTYSIGDQISDPALVSQILNSDQNQNVVKIAIEQDVPVIQDTPIPAEEAVVQTTSSKKGGK